MSTPADKTKIKPPENVLYLSRIEICRILEALAQEGTAITAAIAGGGTLVSHILHVDQQQGQFIISYGSNKAVNSKMLELPALKFTANHNGALTEFEVSSHIETQFNGELALQYALPNSLVLSNRREHPRIPIPAEASLRCIADEGGFASFESHISDISHDGLGGLIYDTDINLEPGTVLKKCRIITHNGKAVIADLEVRNINIITLPGGALANRVGFRFIQRPEEITELINYFIQDLDKK